MTELPSHPSPLQRKQSKCTVVCNVTCLYPHVYKVGYYFQCAVVLLTSYSTLMRILLYVANILRPKTFVNRWQIGETEFLQI